MIKTFDEGKTPDENQWNRFFASPGYQGLFKWGQADRDMIQKEIASVYSKTENEKTKPSAYFQKIIQERKELEQLSVQLESGDPYLKVQSAIRKFVPQSLMNNVPGPTSYFLFGLGDFMTVDDYLVLDLNNYGKSNEQTLYWLQNHTLGYYLSQSHQYNADRVLVKHEGLLSGISGLIQYGASQCLSNGLLISTKEKDKPNSIDSLLWRKVQIVPKSIITVDSLLQSINEKNEVSVLEEVAGILSGKQTQVGYYIISAIHKELGDSKVNEYFGSPVRLLILYNEAAKNRAEQYPVLSAKTIKYLKGIEQKYLL